MEQELLSVFAWYCPASHRSHADAPVLAAYCPEGHTMQAVLQVLEVRQSMERARDVLGMNFITHKFSGCTGYFFGAESCWRSAACGIAVWDALTIDLDPSIVLSDMSLDI